MSSKSAASSVRSVGGFRQYEASSPDTSIPPAAQGGYPGPANEIGPAMEKPAMPSLLSLMNPYALGILVLGAYLLWKRRRSRPGIVA